MKFLDLIVMIFLNLFEKKINFQRKYYMKINYMIYKFLF